MTMSSSSLQLPIRGLPSSLDDGSVSASSAAPSLNFSDDSASDHDDEPLENDHRRRRRSRASTRLIAQNARDIQRITGESTAEIVGRCCGGGCLMQSDRDWRSDLDFERPVLPDNDAFRALKLNITEIPTVLSNVCAMPPKTVSFCPIRPSLNTPPPSTSAASSPSPSPSPTDSAISLNSEPTEETETLNNGVEKNGVEKNGVDTAVQPPLFVQPHPPYHVYPARIHSARVLTNQGAAKRTYHLDLDVTDYPVEEQIDFKVGGAIGVTAPNDHALVQDLFDCLMVPRPVRDRPVLMKTTGGRWPTVWGDELARELVTTRRDVLTWCSDLQSFPPTKPLLRVLAEHAADRDEKKILMYLCAAEGQGVFCELRTGPHITVPQLLHAFPSSTPPLDELLSCLQQLMPRFYSLSNDPHEPRDQTEQTEQTRKTQQTRKRRLIEIAATVHEAADWRGGIRTGMGSGFLERQAQRFLAARAAGDSTTPFHVPMFKGLMANPLARQFNADGPMLLIGAGVGIAPFRGFVQRRLKHANCANKVWVLQGIRDSLLDEIYSGEWGVHEDEVKRVVQSRRGEYQYVQEEVRHQADLVWEIVNAVDGRIFVCGSSNGMGEGVEHSLVDVAMKKGNLEREEAAKFWALKKDAGQYIVETW